MITSGMAVAEVRHLAQSLRQGADRLRGVVSTVDARVNHSSWVGPQADRFRHEFWPARRSQMLRAADALQGLAQSAGNNADEQERASGGQAGGWQHSSVTFSTATDSTVLSLGLSAAGVTLGETLRRLITDPTVRLAVERSLERTVGGERAGNGSLAGLPAEYRLGAEAYARVYGKAGVEIDSRHLAADAEAGAIIGARLQADGHIGDEHAGVGARGYAEPRSTVE